MATPPSISDSSVKILKYADNETNRNPQPNSDDPFEDFMMSTRPSVVFLRGALLNTTMAAAMGFGIGLLDNQGFRGSLEVGRSLSEIATYSTIVCNLAIYSLRSLLGKDDAYTAGLAGCCTGLATTLPDVSPITKCVIVGSISFIEALGSPAPAHSSSSRSKRSQSHFTGVLPPLALPLPNELKESFSSFCESIRKCN